ncbi:MAG: twin-arginine translocase TatA/TatE family subunit [Luteolibacter sp.]
MGSLGTPELVLIFIVILLLFGAKKLPELARGLGKSMGEFKKAREDFEREITRAAEDVRVKEAPNRELHQEVEVAPKKELHQEPEATAKKETTEA